MVDTSTPGQKLRVIMAVPQYPYPVMGGLERQSHELAKALLQLGVGVQAVSGKITDSQPNRETVEGILVHRIPWPQSKLRRFFQAPFSLFSALYRQRHTYDVIHLHQFSWFGIFVILAAGLLRKPVLTKLPSVGEMSLPGIASSPLGTIKLAIFKRTDAVVAMSGESLDELEAAGFPLQQVLRTPNGIRLLAPR
ncbi:MAG: glycosyltransferase, partial [Gammaproteobacteria bacterium]|nr:glycosyltransferase [Gammaproteobacteria bacterium]